MSRILRQIEIDAPAGRVWEVLADFGSVERWAPTVVDSRCPTETARGLGAKRLLTTSRGQIAEEVVVAWDEGRGFTFEIPGGLAPMIKALRETWSVGNAGTATEVVVAMDYEVQAGVINAILGRLIAARVLQQMLVQNLVGLKKYVETGQDAPTDVGRAHV